MTITETPHKITNSRKVYEIMAAILSREEPIDQDKEHFWVIGINARNVTKYIELVSLGTLNSSVVHPREVFRMSISQAVASIIICHNHPSNEVDPSEDDLIITKRLAEAGKILGIEVLDHLIIGKNNFLSLKERGVL